VKTAMLAVVVALFSVSSVPAVSAQEVPEEARASFVQAVAMMKAAKGPEEMTRPIELLRKAVVQAPTWADAHYNLARALEFIKAFDEAIAEYNRYLELNPVDPGARKIRDHTYELRAEQENYQQKQRRAATGAQLAGWWNATVCIACNDKDLVKPPRRHAVQMHAPVAFTVLEDGTIKIGFTSWDCGGAEGAFYGVPDRDGDGIRWESRDRQGVAPPRELWAEQGRNVLKLSCTRSVSEPNHDPKERHTYLVFSRQQ
jgi:hypothetical protein